MFNFKQQDMIGSLIGAGIGILGSVFGGHKASQAAKQAKANVERQKVENANWYNRRYNEDATQRADAQRILTITNEAIRDRNRAAQGRAAVMGTTSDELAAEQEANTKVMADAAAQIAAQGANTKDRIEATYMDRKDALQEKLNQIEHNRANAVAEATKGVAAAGASIADAIDTYDVTHKTDDTTKGLF